MTGEHEHPPRAGAREWVGLGLLMVPFFMAAVDMTVVFLAIPTIAADLLPSSTQQLWVLHVGDIAGASLVMTAGRLVDRFGPRRLLLFGLIGYGTASALAAFAPTIETLILARMLLGASTVTMGPAGMALLRHMFRDPRQFASALALFMAAFSGGVSLGPPLGGFLLEHYWWGSIFLINVPIAALTAVLAGRLVPTVAGSGTGTIDIASIAQSAGGIVGVVYGAQEVAANGWSVGNGLAILAGGLLLTAFIRRQRVVASPLLDLSLFRSAPFALALIAIWVVIASTAGAELQLAQHLQVVVGHSPLASGMLLMIPALVSVVATAAAPILLRWLRPGYAIGAGVLLAAGGAVSMLIILAGGPPASAIPLIASAAVVAAGISPAFALGTTVMLTHVPTHQTGSASAVQEVGGSLGNTAGLAIGGSVAHLGYSRTLAADLPTGVSGEFAQRSLDGIGGALSAAQDLPPALAAQLTDAAQAAFTVATRDAYLVAVVGLSLLSALVLWGMRGIRADDGEDPDTEAGRFAQETSAEHE